MKTVRQGCLRKGRGGRKPIANLTSRVRMAKVLVVCKGITLIEMSHLRLESDNKLLVYSRTTNSDYVKLLRQLLIHSSKCMSWEYHVMFSLLVQLYWMSILSSLTLLGHPTSCSHTRWPTSCKLHAVHLLHTLQTHFTLYSTSIPKSCHTQTNSKTHTHIHSPALALCILWALSLVPGRAPRCPPSPSRSDPAEVCPPPRAALQLIPDMVL